MADLVMLVLTPLVSAAAGGLFAGVVALRRIEREFDLRRQERWTDHQIATIRELASVSSSHFEAVRKTLGLMDGYGRTSGTFRPPQDFIGHHESLYDTFGETQAQMRVLATLVGIEYLPAEVDKVIGAANDVIGCRDQDDLQRSYDILVKQDDILRQNLGHAATSVFKCKVSATEDRSDE